MFNGIVLSIYNNHVQIKEAGGILSPQPCVLLVLLRALQNASDLISRLLELDWLLDLLVGAVWIPFARNLLSQSVEFSRLS